MSSSSTSISVFTLSLSPSPTTQQRLIFTEKEICKTFWQTDNQLIVIFCRFALECVSHSLSLSFVLSFSVWCRLFMIQMTYSTFYLYYSILSKSILCDHQMWTRTHMQTKQTIVVSVLWLTQNEKDISF